jgi:glutathione synthase/RimK-type ligase-like ATP-grasp enzyme
MNHSPDAVILNNGQGAWAFETHATHLSQICGVPVRATPAPWNYLLSWDTKTPPSGQCFIPFQASEDAADKRIMAQRFAAQNVPTPETHLVDDDEALQNFLRLHAHREWLLKWPVGCGGTGHRFVQEGTEVPADWPRPFVVQEFVCLEKPEVFRLYAVAGELFGWNARRFDGETDSPFVAHARGAHYEIEAEVPAAALEAAQSALKATNLLSSFGCADLLRDQNGQWLVLEVNTDGRWMHVDRDVPEPIAREIDTRIGTAFRRCCEGKN